MTFKTLYHRLLPGSVRYPIGAARRRMADGWLRWRRGGQPLPPSHLLEAVQMTPWVREYLEVGERASISLRRHLLERGLEVDSPHDVLDFGCGLGRVLRFFTDTSWRLAGCDVDARLIDWSRRSFPQLDWRHSAPEPPLPFEDDSFDALWAVSVFTHFDAGEQERWARELGRILRPGATALISLMGPHALGAFPALEARARGVLESDGFFFQDSAESFNRRGAFHTRGAVERFFAPHFHLETWIEGGLDGFQDLAVLTRTR